MSWCEKCGAPYLSEQGHRCAQLPAKPSQAVGSRRSARHAEPPKSNRDLIKEIAMDIGKETVAYIEVMYPQAIEAASSTFKLAVRNHIYNQIMAAIEVSDEDEIIARLQDRKKFRRRWVATYRKIRRKVSPSPLATGRDA